MNTRSTSTHAYFVEREGATYTERGYVHLPAVVPHSTCDALIAPLNLHDARVAVLNAACALPLTLALTELVGHPCGLYGYTTENDPEPGWHPAEPALPDDVPSADVYLRLPGGPTPATLDVATGSHLNPNSTQHWTWGATTGDALVVHPHTIRRAVHPHVPLLVLRYASIRHRNDLPHPRQWTNHDLVTGWHWLDQHQVTADDLPA